MGFVCMGLFDEVCLMGFVCRSLNVLNTNLVVIQLL